MCIRKMSSNKKTVNNNIRKEIIKSDIKNTIIFANILMLEIS